MSNDYYNGSGAPATRSVASSATMRAEFELVEAGFDKLAPLNNTANRVLFINTGNTAVTTNSGFTFDGATLTVPGLTLTGAAVFNNTVSVIDGNLSIKGSSDSSKVAKFEVDGFTTNQTRTFTLPDASGTVPLTSMNLSVFAATTSAQMAGVISDETGSGPLVFANAPTLVTPTLGVATATSINNLTLTQPANNATITVGNGKTLTANNTVTLAGTDGKTLTINGSLTLAGNDGKTLTVSNSVTLAGVDGKTLTVNNSIAVAGTDGTTITFQGTDTYVGRATTDTLTNKTLTGAAVTDYLRFSASQVPSAGANDLDDYEEGTWTPAFNFTTPGDLNVTYSHQVGVYTKIGNAILSNGSLQTSNFNHTTASGNALMTGLPFTSRSTSNMLPVGASTWQGIAKANYTDVNARIINNSATNAYIASGNNQSVSAVVATDMPTGGTVSLRTSITYFE